VGEPLVEMVVGTPAAPLRAIIGRYRGYRIDGPPGTHRGLPSPHLTVIISLDEPVDIPRMPADAQAPGRFQAFVAGLNASPASIRHDGFQHGLSLELTPLGARALAGVAVRSGYYDQAHLTREWREIAGCTPTTWMAEELPFVQDDAARAGAS
jgi:hypothetical protein